MKNNKQIPCPDNSTIRDCLIYHIVELNEDEALSLVKERLALGHDPLAIVEDCNEGMRQVGKRYEQGKYFLSGLIMAGEIFRQVMELAQPVIEAQISGNESGRILLGTVQGDIHDIGKNIQGMLLRCYGFTVLDLGVDVPPEEFLTQARQFKPDIIGLSGLLTSSYDTMRETIRTLRQSGDNGLARVPVVIGGSTLSDQVRRYTGADYWISNAMDGVRLCQKLLSEQQTPASR